MKNKLSTLLFCLSALSFASCEKEKDEASSPLPDNLNGVFVINEGAFLDGNASVSFFSSDSAYSTSDIFEAANGFPVGDVLQSMTIFNNRAFLCVNNSQKVEVVYMGNFKKTGTIFGANSPRFFCGWNASRGFISDWSTNKVYLINLNSLSIIDSIACGQGPEQMLIDNNKLFICNSGGFTDDSTITVVDVNTLNIITEIPCGVNPASICKDANGKIWVMCRGSLGSDFTPTPDDPGGRLLKIDPSSLNIELAISFVFDQHPLKLTMNSGKDTLYYLKGSSTYTGQVFKMGINDIYDPVIPFIEREMYALGIHPGGTIYTGKASFSSNSQMYRFANDGTLLDSAEVGIGPNSFVFH
ncbi:MAG: hypothetical protein IPJ86_08710 [Bacteroidetes bacterium]|nr:hypothetical protein [Bacteroidota bacterium]